MVGAKCKASFDTANSLASVLGFKQDIFYGVGRHASEKLVNIMSVNSILVHCNITNLPPCSNLRTCVISKFQLSIISFRMLLLDRNFGSAIQFNLPPSDCRRHFNFVSVADGPRRRALGFAWREIDNTF